MRMRINYTSNTITTSYRTRFATKSVLSNLSFLNFVIRLSDDSGINEEFPYITTGEKYRNT